MLGMSHADGQGREQPGGGALHHGPHPSAHAWRRHAKCQPPQELRVAPHGARSTPLACCTPPSASPAGCVENQLLGNTASGVPWSKLHA